MVTRLLFISTFVLLLHRAEAQSCFARVQLDRKSVYVQQPFKVTITVLTATWYTAPIEFDNLQVPNAFVLPFDRTVPGMFDYNGKQYAGIQFYFIVFPYKAGNFSLPAITVHATTPPEGSSESKRISLKTPVQHYTVKNIPSSVSGSWFVAKSVSIREHWNKPLSHLKVGDVIERTITIRASGTLPQFIPALHEVTLDFANVYPQDPELRDTRNEYDANGELTQSFTYLLEKEGDFVIPAMPVQWWNSGAGRLNKQSLPAHNIHVNTNPDLGMLATIEDSLNVNQKPIPDSKSAKQTATILGLPWYVFGLYALIVAAALYLLVRWSLRIVHYGQRRYSHYKQSEAYWFRKLLRSGTSWPEFWKNMYAWWDRSSFTDKEPSMQKTARQYNLSEVIGTLQHGNAVVYEDQKSDQRVGYAAKKSIKMLRKQFLKHTNHSEIKINNRQSDWDGCTAEDVN